MCSISQHPLLAAAGGLALGQPGAAAAAAARRAAAAPLGPTPVCGAAALPSRAAISAATWRGVLLLAHADRALARGR